MTDNNLEPRTLTLLLERASDGDQESEHRFYELVNDELRKIATGLLRKHTSDSMDTTMLVNELLVQFIEKDTLSKSKNRRYFFAVAIDQMRKILIAHYRKKKSLKKGGNMNTVPLDKALDQITSDFERTHQFDFEALENALARLKERNSRQYEVIIYRFYGGLSVADTAKALDVSVGSVERDWRLARAKLFAELRSTED